MRVRVGIEILVAALLLACGIGVTQARDFTAPRLTLAKVDWDAALTALDKVEALKHRLATASPEDVPPDAVETIARLNRATQVALPNIAASPVPVLLPFDLTGFLRARDQAADEPAANPFAIFNTPKLFLPGPAGYDAAFTLRPRDVAEFSDIAFKEDVVIQITGAAFHYELDNTVKLEAKPIALEAQFPGIRRGYLQSHMRYIFERYGVTYTVSILCFDARSRAKRLSCREADPIALRFLASLQLVGGTPQPLQAVTDPALLDRPTETARDFIYTAPGQLIAGTGYRRHGGRADMTVYAVTRFPFALAPAHVYSQMFMFSGDCAGVDTPRTTRRGGALFRCPEEKKEDRKDDKVADATGGISPAALPVDPPVHPWRDNFCETRDFSVGQCPAGLGHQGQDIVPAHCAFEGDRNRCDAQRLMLVASHSGTILREPGQEGLVIVVNTPDAHLRLRYLHMDPKALDADGMLSGRVVSAGEPVGKMSNFSGREDGTSHHLHFDMQVLTRDGWILVNPYATLVSAYERLIGARGAERIEPLHVSGAALEVSHPLFQRPAKIKRRLVKRRIKHHRRASR